MQVLNVIELNSENSPQKIESFLVTEENKKVQIEIAETRFLSLISESRDLSEEDKEYYLDNGSFQEGGRQIFLTWSDEIQN